MEFETRKTIKEIIRTMESTNVGENQKGTTELK